MEIIPAIDLINGECVRLVQGDYAQKTTYSSSPLDVAKQFEDAGIKRLHLVDLDGAKAGYPVNVKVLEMLASGTSLKIDFGGGIKTEENVRTLINAGTTYVTIGSLAVKNETLFKSFIKTFGASLFLLGADVKNENIATSGWLETSQLSIYQLLDNYSELTNYFCTDIAKDGLLQGPSFELYKKLIARFPIKKLIASGGVSCYEDLVELKSIGCSGAIVGKAYYEGKISLKQLSTFN
jgi:phosphoribosylformimino-5-aminoimidazole carboxamide ribotide isomerase